MTPACEENRKSNRVHHGGCSGISQRGIAALKNGGSMSTWKSKTRIAFGVLLLGLSLVVTVTAQAQARQQPNRQQQERRLPEHFAPRYVPRQNDYRVQDLGRLHSSFYGYRDDFAGRDGLRFSEGWREPTFRNWDVQRRFLPDQVAIRFANNRLRWHPPTGFDYIGGYYYNGIAINFSVAAAYDGVVVGPNFVPAYWRFRPWSQVWCDPYGRCYRDAPVLAATDVVLVEVPQTIAVDDGYGGVVYRKVVSLETASYEPAFVAGWGSGAFVFNDWFGARRGFINVHVRLR
jgi:hypothetical protein